MPNRIIILALSLGAVWLLFEEFRSDGSRPLSRFVNTIIDDPGREFRAGIPALREEIKEKQQQNPGPGGIR